MSGCLKEWGTRKAQVQLILCSSNDACFGKWIVFPASWECNSQQGRENLGSGRDQRCPPMLTPTSGMLVNEPHCYIGWTFGVYIWWSTLSSHQLKDLRGRWHFFQRWTVAPYGSGASTEPCKPQFLSRGQACGEASQPYGLRTTGGAVDRKQGCQQTILNSHSKPQGSGGRVHFLA